jgi:hypothetical protein
MRKPNKESQNESARIAEAEKWVPAKEIAPRIGKSTSYIYSLVRRGSTIPHVEPSPGTILFHWPSVHGWLLDLQAKKRRANFED